MPKKYFNKYFLGPSAENQSVITKSKQVVRTTGWFPRENFFGLRCPGRPRAGLDCTRSRLGQRRLRFRRDFI